MAAPEKLERGVRGLANVCKSPIERRFKSGTRSYYARARTAYGSLEPDVAREARFAVGSITVAQNTSPRQRPNQANQVWGGVHPSQRRRRRRKRTPSRSGVIVRSRSKDPGRIFQKVRDPRRGGDFEQSGTTRPGVEKPGIKGRNEAARVTQLAKPEPAIHQCVENQGSWDAVTIELSVGILDLPMLQSGVTLQSTITPLRLCLSCPFLPICDGSSYLVGLHPLPRSVSWCIGGGSSSESLRGG